MINDSDIPDDMRHSKMVRLRICYFAGGIVGLYKQWFDHGGKQRSVQLHIGAVEKRKDEHDNGDHLACLGQVFILYGHADVLSAYASL